MKVKVSEASGVVLDWMVASIECHPLKLDPMGFGNTANGGWWIWGGHKGVQAKIGTHYSPTTNPAQAWPIIEQEEISTQHTGDAAKWRAHVWDDNRQDFWPTMYGPTSLIAAMRCYVASKLGEEVDVPQELLS